MLGLHCKSPVFICCCLDSCATPTLSSLFLFGPSFVSTNLLFPKVQGLGHLNCERRSHTCTHIHTQSFTFFLALLYNNRYLFYLGPLSHRFEAHPRRPRSLETLHPYVLASYHSIILFFRLRRGRRRLVPRLGWIKSPKAHHAHPKGIPGCRAYGSGVALSKPPLGRLLHIQTSVLQIGHGQCDSGRPFSPVKTLTLRAQAFASTSACS